MKGISKREKGLLLIFGIVVIVYLYYSLFYTPIRKKIESARANTNKYIQEISGAKTNKELFDQYTSALENIKTKYEEAKLVLPEMEMNPEIIYNIQKFFQGSGVKVTGITIGTPEEPQDQSSNTETKTDNQSSQNNSTNENQVNQDASGKLITVPVTITLSADNYEEVMKFISLFENSRRFAEITDIAITANRPAVQPVAESLTKPNVVKNQAVDNEIQVVVVGEGEEYTEIPVAGTKVEEVDESETVTTNAGQNGINSEQSQPKIEVNITARYYYIDTKTKEQPDYSFKNGVYGKKDLFKE